MPGALAQELDRRLGHVVVTVGGEATEEERVVQHAGGSRRGTPQGPGAIGGERLEARPRLIGRQTGDGDDRMRGPLPAHLATAPTVELGRTTIDPAEEGRDEGGVGGARGACEIGGPEPDRPSAVGGGEAKGGAVVAERGELAEPHPPGGLHPDRGLRERGEGLAGGEARITHPGEGAVREPSEARVGVPSSRCERSVGGVPAILGGEEAAHEEGIVSREALRMRRPRGEAGDGGERREARDETVVPPRHRGTTFQNAIPLACWPMSTVATFVRARRSITSTFPGAAPTPSLVTKA